MRASRLGCWVTGIVTVEAPAKTNSVTMSEGMRLDAFLSTSFRSAPSRDYIKNILARVPVDQVGIVYLCSRHSIVNIRFHAAMKAQIQLLVKVIHCDAVDLQSAGVG